MTDFYAEQLALDIEYAKLKVKQAELRLHQHKETMERHAGAGQMIGAGGVADAFPLTANMAMKSAVNNEFINAQLQKPRGVIAASSMGGVIAASSMGYDEDQPA